MSDRDADYAYESGRNGSDYAFNQQQERYGAGVDAVGSYQRGQDAVLTTWATVPDEPPRSRSSTPSTPSSSSGAWGVGGKGSRKGDPSPGMASAAVRYGHRKDAPQSPLRTVVIPLFLGVVLLVMALGALTQVLAVYLLVGGGYNALKLYSTRRAGTRENEGCLSGLPEQRLPAPTVSHAPPFAVPTAAPSTAPSSSSPPQTTRDSVHKSPPASSL